MNLGIRFPSDVDVIAEETARFRALTGPERIEVIRGMLAAGALLLRNSPKSEFLKQHAAEQEAAWRRAVQEFIARHAN